MNPQSEPPPHAARSSEATNRAEPPGAPARRWRLTLAAAALGVCLVVCATAGALALWSRPAPTPVTVVIAQAAQQIATHAVTVGALLDELGLVLNEGDVVSPAVDSTLTPGLVIRVDRARLVTLTIDGDTRSLQTLYTNPFDILRDAGITIGERDLVLVDGSPATLTEMLVWPVPASQISIRRALTVTISDGSSRTTVQTTRQTVGEALFDAGITLYLADTVTPDISAPVTAGMLVTIRRSRPISIVADGVTLEARAQGTTVVDALAEVGVTLMGLDYSIPAESSPLRPGMLVRVIRVTEQLEFEQTVIPFETVFQADPNLELDQRQVLQEGQNGVLQTTIRVRYENGSEVSRLAESEQVAAEPVNRVVAYGTLIVLRTIDTPDGPRQYWRRLRMYATSYHPAALGGDAITATGRRLTKGVVGSNPRIIPYDTELYVPGYGVGIMADTGILPQPMWIDLGYDDENYVPWSRWVDVYLLTPVPAEIMYLLPDSGD